MRRCCSGHVLGVDAHGASLAHPEALVGDGSGRHVPGRSSSAARRASRWPTSAASRSSTASPSPSTRGCSSRGPRRRRWSTSRFERDPDAADERATAAGCAAAPGLGRGHRQRRRRRRPRRAMLRPTRLLDEVAPHRQRHLRRRARGGGRERGRPRCRRPRRPGPRRPAGHPRPAHRWTCCWPTCPTSPAAWCRVCRSAVRASSRCWRSTAARTAWTSSDGSSAGCPTCSLPGGCALLEIGADQADLIDGRGRVSCPGWLVAIHATWRAATRGRDPPGCRDMTPRVLSAHDPAALERPPRRSLAAASWACPRRRSTASRCCHGTGRSRASWRPRVDLPTRASHCSSTASTRSTI